MTKNSTESTGSLLYISVGQPAVIEVAKDISEAALDSVIENEALKAVPVFGAFLKISKGVMDFREKRYIQKIARFIFESSRFTSQDKKKYDEKLANSQSECRKAGEAILEILDNVIGTEKARFLGMLFHAYIREDMPLDNFIQYAEIIERTYAYDLTILLTSRISSKNCQGLISSGIVTLYDMDTIYNEINKSMGFALRTGGSGSVLYNPTLTSAGFEIKRILTEYSR